MLGSTFRRLRRTGALRKLTALSAAVAITGAPLVAQAGPQGAQVINGQVVFVQNGNVYTIHASHNSIINYSSFNIAGNETVRFIQPHQLARVLNRIDSALPTSIHGSLLSNGIVYLVNPAGVMFGSQATIDVGGLYAAAANISNTRFLAGIDRFSTSGGEVSNYGKLRGDFVHLIGSHVSNHGLVRTNNPGGIITMLAGNEIVISESFGRIQVRIDGAKLTDSATPAAGQTAPDTLATPGVENTGVISAKRGQVVVGAGDMYALAMRNTGLIEAAKGRVTVAAADGAIHNLGQINANALNGQAGSVVVQGPSIVNAGVISADAQSGHAGSVEVTSQNHTYLLNGSRVSAAGTDGIAHGGELLIHSYDGHTKFSSGAVVDVSGGQLGGHGGFAEVSARDLTFVGKVKLKAKQGFNVGSLLIDPTDIFIVDGAFAPDDAEIADNAINFGDASADDFYISNQALSILSGTVTLQALRDIFIDAEVNFINAVTVVLEADRHIHFNASLNGMHSLTAFADHDGIDGGTLFLHSPLTLAGEGHFRGSMIDLNASITGDQLTFHNQVKLSGNSAVEGYTSVTFDGTINSDGVAARDLAIASPLTTFNGSVGNTDALGTLWLQTAGGTAVLSAPQFEAQKLWFQGGVQIGLGADGGTVTGTDWVTFEQVLDGQGNSLTINGGTLSFNAVDDFLGLTTDGLVGVTFNGQVTNIGSLNAFGPTLILTDLISGGQLVFHDAVTVGNHLALGGAGTTLVDFKGTLNSASDDAYDLTINSTATHFRDQVGAIESLGTLEVNGVEAFINTNVMKAQTLTFNANAWLQQNAVLTGVNQVNFNGLLNSFGGTFNLTVRSDEVNFFDEVGTVNAFGVLRTRGDGIKSGGVTNIYANMIADQLRFQHEALIRTDGLVLTGTSLVHFEQLLSGFDPLFNLTIDGGLGGITLEQVQGLGALDLNSPGLTTFTGGMSNVGALTTDAPGATVIATSDTIAATNMIFNDDVELAANATLGDSTTALIDFKQRINSDSLLTPRNLTVNALNTHLRGTVGDTFLLGHLVTDDSGGGGLTNIYSTINADQLTFNDEVLIHNDTTLTGNTSVHFAKTLSGIGAQSLTLAVQGDQIDFVGMVHNFDSLTTSGTTTLSFGEIQDVTFLNANASGLTTFGGNVSNVFALTTDAGGTTRIDADSISATLISFNDAVLLARDTMLTAGGGGFVNFGSTLDSEIGAFSLTINAPTVTFNDQVGNASASSILGTLEVNGVDAFINTNVMKAQTLTFNADAWLQQNAVLTGVNQVNFNALNTLGGAFNLTVRSNQVNFFDEVGAVNAFGVLRTRGDGFKAGGVTNIHANMIADELRFQHDAIIHADNLLLTGTSLVHFEQLLSGFDPLFNLTIDGGLGGITLAQVQDLGALDLNSPGLTTFTGGMSNVGALTTDAPGTTVIATSDTIAATNMIFNDDVELAANATLGDSTTALIDFKQRINSDSLLTPRNLTVNALATHFRGTVGDVHKLATLSTDHQGAGDLTHIYSDISADALAFNDDVQIEENGLTVSGSGSVGFARMLTGKAGVGFTVEGGDVTFGGLLNTFDMVLVNASGTTTFGGNVANVGTLITDAAGSTVIDCDSISAGIVHFGDDVTIAQDAQVTGTTLVQFDGTLAGSLAGIDLGLNGGDISIAGLLSNLDSLTVNSVSLTLAEVTGVGALTANVSGATTLGGQITNVGTLFTDAAGTTQIATDLISAGSLIFNDDVQLLGDATLAGSSLVNFGGRLDSIGGAFNLFINSPQTWFRDQVGALGAFDLLQTDADGTTFIADNASVFHANRLRFNDDVRIRTSTTFNSLQLVDFFGTLRSQLGAHSLTINSQVARFRNSVSNFGLLEVNGTADLRADISGHSLAFNGKTLISGTRSVAGSDLVRFGGRVKERIGGASSNLIVNSDLIEFAGPQVNIGGNLVLNHNRSASPQQVATIVALDNLLITTGGDFRMGRNEKFTALKNLSINANDVAFVGDLTTGDNMRVDAPTIKILLRNNGQVRLAGGGTQNDLGVDFVSGGRIDFIFNTLAIDGSPAQGRPVFAPRRASLDVNPELRDFIDETGRRFTFLILDAVFPGNLPLTKAGGTVLDMRAQGPSDTNPDSRSNSAVVDTGIVMIDQEPSLSPAQKRELGLLGIEVRDWPNDLRLVEQDSRRSGKNVYDDAGERNLVQELLSDTVKRRIADPRLPSMLVQNLLKLRREIFPVDEQGNEIKGEDGMNDVQRTFLTAYDDFVNNTNFEELQVEPLSDDFYALFKQHLLGLPTTDPAHVHLAKLREACRALRELGLNSTEEHAPIMHLIRNAAPSSMGLEKVLWEIIEPSDVRVGAL